MALQKLQKRVDPSVNMIPRHVVGERPRTDELVPYASDVWPRGVQCLPVLHEAGRKPRVLQLQ